MLHVIRHDYHAVHHSGSRPLSAIIWGVIHDMESANYKQAAENCGSWFENAASGGSTHYGTDDDSIQQYLPLRVVAWGAPGANWEGVHVEQMGLASWTRAKWLQHEGTLDNTAWLIAHLHGRFGLPIRKLSDDQVRSRNHGWVSHRQLTRVLGVGTHTDPGTNYPYDWVFDKARSYAR